MRLIDADALPKYTGYALSADEVANAVENAPTIEAEPVIRCKNCKHLVAHGGGEAYHCWIHGTSVEEDDWCSWAEARGEE